MQTINFEEQLVNDISELVYDPLGFVYYAYNWGEGALTGESGPDDWQAAELKKIGDNLRTAEDAVQIAVRSGHGIGKTALISWIIHWFMSTRPHPQIPVTANTKEQLLNKTWRELAKWWKLGINKHWFNWTATRFYNINHPETWFASAVPWSKERSEAFAGTHEKHVLLLFDEASAIEDIIFEVAEGAMTTPGALWVVFGNPTRNTGRFSECFKKYRHRWLTTEVDSRTAKKANQKQIQKWIEDYGEDSDFVRVRVKGMEPRAGTLQFIPGDIVETALGRHYKQDVYLHAPKILALDVARFGDDQSVLIRRQGLAATGLRKFRGLDTMTLSSIVVAEIRDYKPDAVFVDGVGIGAGVIDRLRQLKYDVIEVNGGHSAVDDTKYYNRRAEMWGKLKLWLEGGGAIPNDTELRDDLIGPEYGFDVKERIQLEKKTDMKKRGLASPDCGDALSMTFYEDVFSQSDVGVVLKSKNLRPDVKKSMGMKYDRRNRSTRML